jgi:hypothetical protein
MKTNELENRRNEKGEITKILLCDIWGLDHNSLRIVIRDHVDQNLFCLVSPLSGQIVKLPCTGAELRAYLDGKNKFQYPFKYFGRAKDFFADLIDQKTRDEMANLLVYREDLPENPFATLPNKEA